MEFRLVRREPRYHAKLTDSWWDMCSTNKIRFFTLTSLTSFKNKLYNLYLISVTILLNIIMFLIYTNLSSMHFDVHTSFQVWGIFYAQCIVMVLICKVLVLLLKLNYKVY